MSLSKLIAVLLLTCSTLAFADPAADKTKENERKWTILAAEKYATQGKADKAPVADPGVFVTAQRDPQDKR